MLAVYRYIRKSLQQFIKSKYGVKFSVVALSSVVLGTASIGLISQSMHAIPFRSASTTTHKSARIQPDPQQHTKITPTPDAKVTLMPSLSRIASQLPTPVPTAAAPAPTPVPQAPVTGGSSGSVESIIDQVFGSYASGAINVASCESGLNPAATNPASGAAGLFQILPSTFNTTSEAGNSPYDAYANTVAAHDIFVRDGYSWREWTCQP